MFKETNNASIDFFRKTGTEILYQNRAAKKRLFQSMFRLMHFVSLGFFFLAKNTSHLKFQKYTFFWPIITEFHTKAMNFNILY